MSHRELLTLIAPIAGIPSADVQLLSRVLGVPLVQLGPPGRWSEFAANGGTRAFQSASAKLDVEQGFGSVRLKPHSPPPTRAELGIFSDPTTYRLEVNPNIPPRGVTTYVSSQRGGALEVRYVFGSGSDALLDAIVSWQSARVPQGEEAVFRTAPPLIYLRSYDSVDEVLEYACATRAWRILRREESSALGATEAFGAFARGVPAKSGAGELMGGVFATPEGPAIIAGSKRSLVQPVKTQARIDQLPERRRRFSLTRAGLHELELIYEERHGVGTKPYDVEESDVDLFVAIRDGLKKERWLAAHTRPWPG